MILTIPTAPFKAYLFDCDGTLADSLPLHYEAWREALAPYACPFPKELFLAWGGIPVPRTVDMLNERFGLTMPSKLVAEAREAAYLGRLAYVKPHAGVLAHVEAQFGRIPLAVVSGSPRASVQSTLRTLGIEQRFAAIVGAEDVARGKPAPDPYLRAAELLQVKPQDCLVFEDAELGIEAAIAAGMQWVRVPQSI